MKSKFINKLFLLVAVTTLTWGCTKNFEKINTNQSGVTSDVFTADYGIVIQPLKNAQKALINSTNWQYQLQQNLNADLFSGFMASATPFNGGNYNSQYFMMDGWNEWVLNIAYDQVFNVLSSDVPNALNQYNGVDFSDVKAMVKILGVIEMHKAADVFGPIIYTKYGKPNADLSIDYDSQQQAYTAFFANLDSAVTFLQPYASGSKQSGNAFKNADLIYGGNAANWLKLANTLRLRLAVRIAYADAALAKTQGEKALNPANGGIITTNAENAFVNYGSSSPLFDIINNWDDTRAGAPLGCFLNGFNDPRKVKYMAPATDGAVAGQFIGIRVGIALDDKSRYSGYSKPIAMGAAGNYFDSKSGLAKIATAAESHFLKAEAALRGWANAGDIKTNYETGVARSFEEWGAGAAAGYLADATSTAAPYVDPKAAVAGATNIAAGNPNLSTITIKWDDGATTEKKLERIITQKWLALYPDAQEAWSEFRRTGYPKLFPNIVNNSGGAISSSAFIRRLPIPSKYQKSNQSGYTRAVATLGGADNGGTKLWWDKK